jgi:hypothetical protein
MGGIQDTSGERPTASNDELLALVPSPAARVQPEQLPALRPMGIRKAPRRLQRLALACVALGAIGCAYWWTHRTLPLPAAIAVGNGRLEADPIDIATKFAGRILELRVDEGDRVSAGERKYSISVVRLSMPQKPVRSRPGSG